MKLFVRCVRNGKTSYLSYEGQDVATIQALLADLGATNVEFVSQSDVPQE